MSINNVKSTITLNTSLQFVGTELGVSKELIQQNDTYITGSQIRNMPASPIEIVPSGGPNILICLWKVILFARAGSPIVFFTGGSAVYCAYESSGLVNGEASSFIPSDDFIQVCANNGQYQMNGTPATDTSNVTLYAPFFNKGIVLTSIGASFAGGTGTVILAKAWYSSFEVIV